MTRVLLAAAISLAATMTHASVLASWYDCSKPRECSRSKTTASGERFNPNAMTAAHKTLPFGTRVRVCRRSCVVARINDRGPFVRGGSLDLARGAARAIGLTGVRSITMRVL